MCDARGKGAHALRVFQPEIIVPASVIRGCMMSQSTLEAAPRSGLLYFECL